MIVHKLTWLRYPALILLPLGIFLALMEIGLRIYLRNRTFYDVEMSRYAMDFKIESANALIGHVHRPGAQGRLMNVQVRINSDGLRDQEYPVERTPSARRLIFLGDSLTFGWGVEEPKSFATLLEQRLDQAAPTEVINFGTGNYNTTQQTQLFLEKGLKYRPDAVVVFYFINDAEPVPEKSSLAFLANFRVATFYWSRFRQLAARFNPGKTFKEYYSDLYREDQDGWRQTRESFLKLGEVCRDQGMDLRVILLPELHELIQYPFAEQHQMLESFLNTNGIRTLDLAPAFRGESNPYSLWVALDDAHPNARAHRLIADASEAFITEAFQP